MKKLFTLSLMLFATISFAATNFIDLSKSTQRASQWVQQFDSKTKQGGGYFKYYGTSNVGIQNIAGYQIKCAGTSTGYYIRTDAADQFNVVWCGAQNINNGLTLQAQGWTQALADTMWGVGLTNVTTDTYDRTAIAYAYKLMETRGFQKINFEPKDYYVNREMNLPVWYSGTEKANVFIINLNGSRQRATNTNSWAFMQRIPPNQSDAQTYYVRGRFFISNGSFLGFGNQTAINLGACGNSDIRNCQIDSCQYGIVVKFLLNGSLVNNDITATVYPIYLTNGGWTGFSPTNAQSNMMLVMQNHIYCKAISGSTFAGVWVEGCDGFYGLHNTIEGGNPQYNLYGNSLATTTVKDFYYGYAHHENTPTVANIYLRWAGLAEIEHIFTQTASTFLSFDNPGGYPQIMISNIGSLPAGTKFRCTDGGVTWIFNQMRDIDPTLNASWDLTAGGIRPNLGPSNQRFYDNFYGFIR